MELLLSRDTAWEVYLGRHRGLQRAVAIKIYTAPIVDEPSAFADFQFAARNLEALQHPRVASVLESGRADGYPYVVSEYVPGISLASHLRALKSAQRKFDPDHIGTVLNDAAEGLDFGHQRGVFHGDLRPSGVLLTSTSAPVEAGKSLPTDVRAVLTDFRLISQNMLGAGGAAPSVSAYSAPEIRSGEPIDARADVYSLGAILFELLTQEQPSQTQGTALVPIATALQASRPELPAELGKVLERALSTDAAQRYSRAGELASAYEAAFSSSPQPRPVAPVTREARPPAQRPPRKAARPRNWASTAVVAVAIVVLTSIVGARALIGARPADPEADATLGTEVAAPQSAPAAQAGDPAGILRFQDGAALIDEVSFNASALPALAPGSQYQVWLLDVSGEERRSLGYLVLDAAGAGSTSLVDADGRNLLGLYQSLEVTVEADPDSSPNPAGEPVYSATLPEEGLLHVRHLLVSFARAPKEIGLLDGLVADTQLLDAASRSMLDNYEAGLEAGTRSDAEIMLNVLVGSQSPDYQDWDADAQIEDTGDGYGLLLNGENSGYIQGSISHAGFAAASPTATSNMQSHGDHVVVSARNLEAWAPELRDLLKQIVSSPFDSDMGALVRQAVALSHNMLAGTDLNGNERIEAITGEGGAETAYQHALYMADIVVTLPE